MYVCVCRNYVFNYLTMACEAAGGKGAEEAGQKGSKLPGQKEAKLPGQPCTAASQCVEGLVCNRTTCACPWSVLPYFPLKDSSQGWHLQLLLFLARFKVVRLPDVFCGMIG